MSSDDQGAAGAGGAAPQPTTQAGGPVPADLTDLLPDGFVLPEGVQLVHVPPVTLEDKAKGALEHASMLRGLHRAALADLEADRVRAAETDRARAEAVEQMGADADAAEAAARAAYDEARLDMPGEVPAHPVFAFLDQPDTQDGEG